MAQEQREEEKRRKAVTVAAATRTETPGVCDEKMTGRPEGREDRAAGPRDARGEGTRMSPFFSPFPTSSALRHVDEYGESWLSSSMQEQLAGDPFADSSAPPSPPSPGPSRLPFLAFSSSLAPDEAVPTGGAAGRAATNGVSAAADASASLKETGDSGNTSEETAAAAPQWHADAAKVGLLSNNGRRFWKKRKAGMISLVYENALRSSHVHAYRYDILQGNVSAADGAGFVFANRVPCGKNIQTLWSVFVNRQGTLCKRMGQNLVRLPPPGLKPLEAGTSVYLLVDLDCKVAVFQMRTAAGTETPPRVVAFQDMAETAGCSQGYFCVVIAAGDVVVEVSDPVELRQMYATQIRPSLSVSSLSRPSYVDLSSSKAPLPPPPPPFLGLRPSSRCPHLGGFPESRSVGKHSPEALPLFGSRAPRMSPVQQDLSFLPSSASAFPSSSSAFLTSPSVFPSATSPSSPPSSSSVLPSASPPPSPVVAASAGLSAAGCSPAARSSSDCVPRPVIENLVHAAEETGLHDSVSYKSLSVLSCPGAVLPSPSALGSCSAPRAAPSSASSASSPSSVLSNGGVASPEVLALPSGTSAGPGLLASAWPSAASAAAGEETETVQSLRERDERGDRDEGSVCLSRAQKLRLPCPSRNVSPLRFCASSEPSTVKPERVRKLSGDCVSVRRRDSGEVEADPLTPLVVSLARDVTQEGSPAVRDTGPSDASSLSFSFSLFSPAVSSAPSRYFTHSAESAATSRETARLPCPPQSPVQPLFLSHPGGLFDGQAFLSSSPFARCGSIPFSLPPHLCGPNAAAASVAASAATQLPYLFLEFERLVATAVGGAIVASENLPASLSSFASSPSRLVWNNRAASAHVIAAAAHMTAAAQAIALEAQQEAEPFRAADCAATASWAPSGGTAEHVGEAGKKSGKPAAEAPEDDAGVQRPTEGRSLEAKRHGVSREGHRLGRQTDKSVKWEDAELREEVGTEIIQSSARRGLQFVAPLLSPDIRGGRLTSRPSEAPRDEETFERKHSVEAAERECPAETREEEGASSAAAPESREEGDLRDAKRVEA
ncbi:hypothetical protein TGFOU_208510 [Toxoplasma gondii FOU]|uniref:Uncharacterized protein n=2 Tax=Toxoplasma gondii TaxID=5811 RepID=A0A086KYE0_TOXGO|nr:hypothetical protein TGFOU_208510 [Toxoplasma gondii FOU]